MRANELSKIVYATQVANDIMHIASIVEQPFEIIHYKVYEIAGLNAGSIIINHALKQTDIDKRQSLIIPKKMKELIVGSTVNPDVLKPDAAKEHSMKWQMIWMKVTEPYLPSTTLHNLNEQRNKPVEHTRKMITDGKAVIRDVVIKCFNANLDWLMAYYLGPVYYEPDNLWVECVMIGQCQVSEDEITLTFKKTFSDELMKDKKFAEMADDLMYALFDKANSY